MAKNEILKYHVLTKEDNEVKDSILITREQEKLLLWLIDNEYIDEDYWGFYKITSIDNVTDLTWFLNARLKAAGKIFLKSLQKRLDRIN